jgi:hypothetical protein
MVRRFQVRYVSPHHGDDRGGREERVGDRAAVIERKRDAELAVDLGDE